MKGFLYSTGGWKKVNVCHKYNENEKCDCRNVEFCRGLFGKSFAQQLSLALIEISRSHLSPFPSFFSFSSLLSLCWLIAFRTCMAVSICINLRSHIRQRLFKTYPYSASCIVGNAWGRCNQSHRSWEEELIIYWSHTLLSIAPLPISNTAASVPIPLFSNFLISAFSHNSFHFLFLKNGHCQTYFFLMSHIWR